MATQDKFKLARRFRRRIELLRPVEGIDDYNETQTVFEPAYTNYPANRLESTSKADETIEDHVLSGSTVVEWELRYIPGLHIKTNWQLKDLFDDDAEHIYEIISPPIEIGNRQGIRVITKLIQ